mgnify:CR=1 FL=1
MRSLKEFVEDFLIVWEYNKFELIGKWFVVLFKLSVLIIAIKIFLSFINYGFCSLE